MQLIHHYIHYRCQAGHNASSAKLITMYVFLVTYTALITGPLAWLSTMDRWIQVCLYASYSTQMAMSLAACISCMECKERNVMQCMSECTYATVLT